jgi:hypothetical protein
VERGRRQARGRGRDVIVARDRDFGNRVTLARSRSSPTLVALVATRSSARQASRDPRNGCEVSATTSETASNGHAYPCGRRRPAFFTTPSSVHRWFKRCLERAELPRSITLHELRHSAGDHVFRATGNIVAAQELLRHESAETTRLYLHPTLDDLAEAMRATDRAWARRGRRPVVRSSSRSQAICTAQRTISVELVQVASRRRGCAPRAGARGRPRGNDRRPSGNFVRRRRFCAARCGGR